ncbi:hypothetical protein SAMN02799641_05725 [Rhodococcus erythropolis]|uniref:hypothetical protein n=1 Tax=Rhodococcus erythropolis TaxID=1833 RepID=UPI000875F85F|nr:hypothetical protein [Rhodococcus erythropolis]SCZ14032.1 hypothetical protein SAMN02799641_05725 [Rhodococcus erythropolis]
MTEGPLSTEDRIRLGSMIGFLSTRSHAARVGLTQSADYSEGVRGGNATPAPDATDPRT